MKICIPSLLLDHGKSGIGTYLISLIDQLQSVDHTNFYDIYLSQTDNQLIPLKKDNFSKKFVSNLFTPPLPNIFWHNVNLPYLTQSEKYDLIHIPSIRRIPLFKPPHPCRLICTIHDLAPLVLSKKYDKLRTFYHHHVLSKLIPNCDHIITVSNNTKNDIIQHLHYPENQISVIYPGVNHNLFKPTPKEQAQQQIKKNYEIDVPFFVYVSRLEHPAKNHIRLIEAFELYKKVTGGKEKLILIGADWFGSEMIKNSAKNSTVNSDIHFLGYVPLNDLPYFYSACDLMIYPSLYEGFGLPVIEALACGAKVICSNNSSLKEIALAPQFCFNPYSVEAIFETMLKIQSGQLRYTDPTTAKNYSQQFCWKKTAQETIRLYEKIK